MGRDMFTDICRDVEAANEYFKLDLRSICCRRHWAHRFSRGLRPSFIVLLLLCNKLMPFLLVPQYEPAMNELERVTKNTIIQLQRIFYLH